MKLLKKISAVSLIILTAALLASCNSSPNAGKRGIAMARATMEKEISFTDETLRFSIADQFEDQWSTINIRVGENEAPLVNVIIKEKGGKIELDWSGLDTPEPVQNNYFDLVISLNNKTMTFKIGENQVGDEYNVTFPSEIFIDVTNGSGWNNLDSISIDEVGTPTLDWEITN